MKSYRKELWFNAPSRVAFGLMRLALWVTGNRY